jgi:hypothetical protein
VRVCVCVSFVDIVLVMVFVCLLFVCSGPRQYVHMCMSMCTCAIWVYIVYLSMVTWFTGWLVGWLAGWLLG